MRRPAIAAACLVTAALLGGCGGGGNGVAAKSPAGILQSARAAMLAAGSVHLTGSGGSATQRISFDVSDGKSSGGGTVTFGSSKVSVVLARSELYLRASKASWTALSGSPTLGKQLADRWVYVNSTDQSFSSVADLLSVRTLAAGLNPPGHLTKGATRSDRGQQVVPVTSSGDTVEVATTGKPYVVALLQQSKRVDFTGYGTTSGPAVPSGAVALSSLAG